jgi:pimeloyl-ACP methyl ester carboxylesterase
VIGEEHLTDVGRGVTLCWEERGDRDDPTVLLVMGLGVSMLGWDNEFCDMLAGRGFHVIRFDNRDSGRSTTIDAVRPPTLQQLALRRFAPEQYTISDMAADAAELLRRIGRAPAHVVGASMGGMIAQQLAAEHPDVVRSLTSIMSMTGSRTAGQPALSAYKFLLRRAPTDREGYIAHTERVWQAIGSPGFPRDVERVRRRAAAAYDRGMDPRGTGRQLAAILKTGNRTAGLRRIVAPTLVVHGKADVLVRPSGGRATHKAIPGSRLELIDGMGHDLPEALWPRLTSLIAEHAHAADGRPRREAAAA